MSRAWPYLAVALGWLLAAVAIYIAGTWQGRLTRYDDCAYTRIATQPVYVCPIKKEPPPVKSLEQA